MILLLDKNILDDYDPYGVNTYMKSKLKDYFGRGTLITELWWWLN